MAAQPAPAGIALQLRQDILRGVIMGGARMRQDAVATRFGVSQNTAREAFRLLEAEGFLRSEPRRGVSVVPLSAAEVEEITQLRILLEVQALDWAMPHFDAAGLDEAAAVLDQLDVAESVDAVLALNAAFHRLLYAPGRRDRTLALIETLRLNFERYLRLAWEQTHHLAQSQGEHRAILQACRVADTQGATGLLQAHIGETGRQVATCLRCLDGGGEPLA